MQLFIMPETYQVMKKVTPTADETKQKELCSVTYEVMDIDTGDIFYFKHGEIEQHTVYVKGHEVPIALNTAKELLAMTYARALGVEVCDFWFAYLPVLKKYGILTRKHSINTYPLLSLTRQIGEKVGSLSSLDFSIAMCEHIEAMPLTSLVTMCKMQACDILTQNSDRHENNILFKDSNYQEFYPYFDCDVAFFNSKGLNLRNMSIKFLIAHSMREFRLFNIGSCLSYLLQEENKSKYDTQSLLLQKPSRELIETTLQTLNLEEYFIGFADYLDYIVDDMNQYLQQALSSDYEAFMEDFMKFIPRG